MLLMLLGYLAAELPLGSLTSPHAGETASVASKPDDIAGGWRRTQDGWQQSETWITSPLGSDKPTFHPLLFASLEILLACGALLAFHRDEKNRKSATKS